MITLDVEYQTHIYDLHILFEDDVHIHSLCLVFSPLLSFSLPLPNSMSITHRSISAYAFPQRCWPQS